MVKNVCESWWQRLLARKTCLSSFPAVEFRRSSESSSGRVKESTGYGQGWAGHQAHLYGFRTSAKRWMRTFHTQNQACLHWLFFRFWHWVFLLHILAAFQKRKEHYRLNMENITYETSCDVWRWDTWYLKLWDKMRPLNGMCGWEEAWERQTPGKHQSVVKAKEKQTEKGCLKRGGKPGDRGITGSQ